MENVKLIKVSLDYIIKLWENNMRIISLIAIFSGIIFVFGCASKVPVYPEFPKVPEEFLETPKCLTEAKESDRMSDLLNTVVENYSICNNNYDRLILWQTWYKKQQENFNKNGKRLE